MSQKTSRCHITLLYFARTYTAIKNQNKFPKNFEQLPELKNLTKNSKERNISDSTRAQNYFGPLVTRETILEQYIFIKVYTALEFFIHMQIFTNIACYYDIENCPVIDWCTDFRRCPVLVGNPHIRDGLIHRRKDILFSFAEYRPASSSDEGKENNPSETLKG